MGALKLNADVQHLFDSRGDCHFVRLFGLLGANGAASFENDLHDRLFRSPKHVVLDLTEVQGVSSVYWVYSIAFLKRQVEGMGFKLLIAAASPEMLIFFREQGVDKLFGARPSVFGALREIGLVKAVSLDASFVNPFLTATIDVIKVQMGVESRAGRIFLKSKKEEMLGDVSGVIPIASDQFNGAVIVSFPEETFVVLMSRMLGESFTKISPEVADGAAELANMILGQARIALNKDGLGIKVDLPSVIVGRGITPKFLSENPSVVIPFDSDLGKFFVEVCL